MNIHVPQSVEAEAEMRYLSAAKWNIITAQSSKPSIKIVQDSLVGAYKMSKDNKKLTESQFFSISLHGTLFGKPLCYGKFCPKIQHIRRILKYKGKKAQAYNSRGLISLLLPSDFYYEKENNALEYEPIVKIYKGVLYEGALTKSDLLQINGY